MATALIKRRVDASPWVARSPARMGTKACENAPSANRRRSKLGMRNATWKASVQALAPKAAAISCSRTRPVMRESKVNKETIEAARSRFIRQGVRRAAQQAALRGPGRWIGPAKTSRRLSWARPYTQALSSAGCCQQDCCQPLARATLVGFPSPDVPKQKRELRGTSSLRSAATDARDHATHARHT